MAKFIAKEGASLYYLVNEGMGGFLNPPSHPEHSYDIVEKRGGHEMGSMSLSYATTCEHLPTKVQAVARGKLAAWKGSTPDSAWLASVYNYFRHCYSPDGVECNASRCIVDKEDTADPSHHLAYLFVREFYPNHLPDLERIRHNDPSGEWNRSEGT